MRVRKDQRGFTIVELLIAVAILSIVVASVGAFIVVGSRSYASANSDINVQQEAQLSLNQMSDVLIDTTRSVNYVGYDAGGSMQKALKDAEFTFTPEDKSLIMYNGVVEETPAAVPGGTPTKTVDAGNGNKHYHFYWSKDAETLYYAELDVQSTDVDTAAIHFPAFDPTDPTAAGWVVLAERVTDFSVDLSQVEEKRVVQLALTFLDGKKEYETSNNVTIRNKVGVNDAELAPLNKKKTLSVTPRDSGVILEPGETYHFSTPKVTGDNVADRSVTWSLVSSGSPTGGTVFTDAANGVLQVATDEPVGKFKVMITTNAVDSDGNPESCKLEVSIKRVTEVSLNKTDDADADNKSDEVSVGNEFTIGAVVKNENENLLGVQCSGCTADISHDFHVVDWRITQGAEFVDIVDAGDCKQETKYCVKAGTEVGTEIKIAATSELSKNRLYTDVHGEITLTVAKSKETAEPYKGKLKYGEQTLDESVRDGLPTDFSKYVTAIRVVDNSKKEPDKILLHYTIGGGNNYRICP
ncbi:MAG: prepilin-type N-terminal cleavage/methylation domain-containing protein, partial [Lachnospiraceae bacterium]|nr:prepilin-type N-terminal cleavage/methylation domain-containing protein [Lachnospiraceae bacterium]